MRSLYTLLLRNFLHSLPAAVLCCLTVSALAAPPDEHVVISEVVRAKSIARYLPEITSAMVVTYQGQQFYLAEGQAELVSLPAALAAQGLPQLEVLKLKSSKKGEKVKLKMRLNQQIIKTTARVCPEAQEEPYCTPCKKWQIKFLSTRHLGKRLPYNFLFIS